MDAWVLVIIPVAAVWMAAIVFALATVARERSLSTTERRIWIGAVLVAPLPAALVWFALGPHPFGVRLGRDPL